MVKLLAVLFINDREAEAAEAMVRLLQAAVLVIVIRCPSAICTLSVALGTPEGVQAVASLQVLDLLLVLFCEKEKEARKTAMTTKTDARNFRNI